ncbi:replication factor A-related protein [Striga asiatica]|uniref:Replication factor A-related protein n=1 Tax=Striga asiatica TaxID=4170 RepID=A0A5A7P000_STRAF|nr:replication factor A-related protein [Striga asiatica]
MSRTYLPISQITDETRNWTALIQVVERAPIQTSKSDSHVPYRRYLFTYGEGTKVAAVVYKAAIEEFDGLYFPTSATTLLEQKCGQKPRWLSLSTKTGTCLMINLPIVAADRLKQWYADNKATIMKLVEEGMYKDTDKLFPYPSSSEIVTVQRAIASIRYRVDLTAQMAAAMSGRRVVCFIKHYESTHHTVLKLYTIDGMRTDKNLLQPRELAKEESDSASTKITDKELFSPTLKNVLDSLTPAREKPTTIVGSGSTAKKRITFDSHQSSTSGTTIPSNNIPESSAQQTQQPSTICDASPTKKSRPKMD